MYLVITSSKDSYITNKVIDQKFRATDANVGKAATLDLFKMFDETSITGSNSGNEFSRVLIKFDYDKLTSLTSKNLNINDSSFFCKLKLRDIQAGNTTPKNFSLVVYPLSKSFDEGFGSDTISFADLDATNFLTASYQSGAPVLWSTRGAMASGTLGAENLDVIERGDLSDGDGVAALHSDQRFETGNEDLTVDVTKLVSGAIAGQFTNHGFLISFSGSDLTDNKTRFVKRFASRHVKNKTLVPTLEVGFDDSITDNTLNSFFGVTSSLYLRNMTRGTPTNILSGSGLAEVGGQNCLRLKIMSGSYTQVVSASSLTQSSDNTGLPGVYEAKFAIPFDSKSVISGSDTIYNFASKSGSIKFVTVWESSDQSVAYLTSSVIVKSPLASHNSLQRDPDVRISNLRSEYLVSETARIRLFCLDKRELFLPAKRIKNVKKSIVFDKLYYRVRQRNNNAVVIPFDKVKDSNKASADSEGMYFDFDFSSLRENYTYTFEFLVIDSGIEKNVASNVDFTVKKKQ